MRKSDSERDNVPLVSITLTTDDTWMTRYNNGKPCQSYPVKTSDVAAALNIFGSSTGLLPENTLFWSTVGAATRIAIWLLPARREMVFDLNKKGRKMSLRLPGFVFMGQGKRYWIYASPTMPTSAANMIYIAPLPNVATDGLICAGDVEMPIAGPDTIHTAAKLFFESRFNNHLASGKLKGSGHGIVGEKALFDLYAQLAQTGRGFPINRLLPSMTMASLMKVQDEYR